MDSVVDGQSGEAVSARGAVAAPTRRRSQKRTIEPYKWLAAGALGVGIAAALAVPGVAYADDTASTSSASDRDSARTSSSSSTAGPARTKRAAREASDDRSSRAGAVSRDVDVRDRQSADPEDSASPRSEAPAEDAADDDDAVAETAVVREEAGTDEKAVTAHVTSMAVEETADPLAAIDTVDVVDAPSDSAAPAARNVPEAETGGMPTERRVTFTQTAMTSAVVPEAPPAPRTLTGLLTAMLVRLQTTYFNRSPIAKPVQNPGQSSQGVVTGTVGPFDPDGDPLTVELTVGPARGAVEVSADGDYVYAPGAELAAAGGTDKFTVIVRELNADSHSHGLKGLWGRLLRTLTGRATADDASTVTRTVTVTIESVSADDRLSVTSPAESPSALSLDAAPAYDKHDAGLSEPFMTPAAPTGRTLNVRNYGATSNRSWDNDATAIQKAINAAVAGDVVYIPDGTYHVKSTINLKSGVSLVGQSRTKTVLAGAYSSSPHAMIYAAPGTTNLTVSTFRITQATGRTFKAAIRLGTEGSGVVSRIAVKDLSIEKFQRFGVQLQNTKHVLVDGNIIKNATALDGGGSGYGVLVDQSLSNNNWIRNNQIGPVIRHAILIQESANHNLIELNTITGTVSGAIDLHGEDEYANEIRYNTITNGVRNGTTVSPNGAGIEVGEYSGVIGSTVLHDNSGPGNWIHHNTVYNYSFGLRITNNSNYTFIEDNVFYGNVGAGIQADLAPLNNLYLSRNEIYNNGSGVILYDVTQAVVQDNTIRDNKNYGIWTNPGTTGYVITGNTVTGNKVDVTLGSRDGVYLVPVSV